MISAFRRTAATLSALAIIGGAGAGIASAATPDTAGPVQTSVTTGARTWFEPSCEWDRGFDWHYYHYCDTHYWHGGHFNDWQRFDHDNHGYDYDRHR